MKSVLRFVPFGAVLAICAAAVLIAANIHSVEPSGLTVHEWGTFTSVAGEDGSAVEWDALGCKSDLPKFVNDYGYRGFKWTLQGTVRMETPVMYFYSAHELGADVKVAFPQGIVTEWYPQAHYKDNQGNWKRALPPNMHGVVTSLGGAIEWKNVKVQPGTAPALPVESGPNRYYAARQTDSAPLEVGGEHEKFLFYRGVGRFPIPLSARVASDGKIVVENRGGEPVPSVILFENRGGRMGYRMAGAIGNSLALDRPELEGGSLAQLRQELEAALIAQGLFPAEAHAMVETWRDSWFEEGSRLIYIVPTSAVDAILPLQVEPAPLQTARVFVGRIELITPETQRDVQSAIAKSDWPALDHYGRFLDPILQCLFPGDPDKAGRIEQQFRGSQGCR